MTNSVKKVKNGVVLTTVNSSVKYTKKVNQNVTRFIKLNGVVYYEVLRNKQY